MARDTRQGGKASAARPSAILLVDGSRPALVERADKLRSVVEHNLEVVAVVDDDGAVDDHAVSGNAASMRATTSSIPSVELNPAAKR